MNTLAYDRNLPCLNPQCKSHGRPHPNCRCYGFSQGGEVGGYCQTDQAHSPECEYYKEGGEVIDPSQVKVDAPINPSEVKIDIPHSEVKIDEPGIDTEQVKAGLEGAAQGLAGPLATLAETKLMGVDPADIKRRQETYPLTHGGAQAATLVGGMLLGTGEAGLIAKGAGMMGEGAELLGASKLGANIIKSAVEGASFAGSDELTKALLRQPGSDPEYPASHALMHVGAAGLMGGVGGGVFSLGEKLIGKGITTLENEKVIRNVEKVLAKIGEEGKPLDKLGLTKSIKMSTNTAAMAATMKVKAVGEALGVPIPEAFVYEAIKSEIQKPINKAIGKLNSKATDAVIHCMLTNKTSGVPNAIHYATNAIRGVQKSAKVMDAIFKGVSSPLADEVISEDEKNKLQDFIENGQVNQQIQNTQHGEGFAKGGQVSADSNAFSESFPEQSFLLSAAKGRISGYLNSIRPLPVQKLPFDKTTQQKDRQRSYSKALDIAVNPLSVLGKVNSGSLTPEDMRHFTQMFPEAHRVLSKEMTKRIVEAQLKGEAPSYKKRKSMSLFLGANLDSTVTPQAIQAVQMIYAMNGGQQQQGQSTPKKSSATSKLAPSYLTNQQARIQRSQNQKA